MLSLLSVLNISTPIHAIDFLVFNDSPKESKPVQKPTQNIRRIPPPIQPVPPRVFRFTPARPAILLFKSAKDFEHLNATGYKRILNQNKVLGQGY